MRSPHSLRAGTCLRKRRLELRLQPCLRKGAHYLLGDLTVLEQDQGRDRHDSVLGSGLRVLVDVELHDGEVVALLVELLQMRSDDAAGSAPRPPEVDQPRRARLEYLGGEVVVGYFREVACH